MKKFTLRLVDRLWRWYGRKTGKFDISKQIVMTQNGIAARFQTNGDQFTVVALTAPGEKLTTFSIYNTALTDADLEEVKLNGVPAKFKFFDPHQNN